MTWFQDGDGSALPALHPRLLQHATFDKHVGQVMEGVSADGAFGYDGASVAAVTWPEGHARSRNRGRPAGVCTRHFGPGVDRLSLVTQWGSVQYRPASKVGVGFPSATTLDALTAGSVIRPPIPPVRTRHIGAPTTSPSTSTRTPHTQRTRLR